MQEPCMCGALDCPRCFPFTYKDNILWEGFESWKEEHPNGTWEQYKKETEELKAEDQIEKYETAKQIDIF